MKNQEKVVRLNIIKLNQLEAHKLKNVQVASKICFPVSKYFTSSQHGIIQDRNLFRSAMVSTEKSKKNIIYTSLGISYVEEQTIFQLFVSSAIFWISYMVYYREHG